MCNCSEDFMFVLEFPVWIVGTERSRSKLMAASLLGWKSVLVGKTSRMTWNGWDDPTKMERLKTLVITTRRPPSPFVFATCWPAASVCANRTWLKIAEAVDLLDPKSFSGKNTYVSSNILVWIFFLLQRLWLIQYLKHVWSIFHHPGYSYHGPPFSCPTTLPYRAICSRSRSGTVSDDQLNSTCSLSIQNDVTSMRLYSQTKVSSSHVSPLLSISVHAFLSSMFVQPLAESRNSIASSPRVFGKCLAPKPWGLKGWEWNNCFGVVEP